jgi:hypothetical protein
MPNQDLQAQIDQLKKRLDAFNAAPTIPLMVDLAWQNRGFIKTDFFVAGTGAFGANGQYRLVIPGSSINSIVLVTGYPDNAGTVGASMIQAHASNNYGAASTRFDITNPAGTTFRYTYDGTGTDPNINATTLPVGSELTIFSSNFNAANTTAASRPVFTVTGSGANYFEIDNPTPGVVESDKTIGSGGAITGGPLVNTYEMFASGTSGDEFAFVVFLFDKLFITN